MKKSIVIAVIFILGLFIANSYAVEVTRFGPKQYVREAGPPNIFTDTFAATVDEGKIIVKNGEEDGSHRLSSTTIFVNGQEVFVSDDFNQQVYILEATINLVEENSVRLELTSIPEGYITVEVIQDVQPPTATISADPDSIFLGESATLSWTSTNADTITIDPGIGAVDPSGSLTISPEETTTYTITATNDAGQASDSVTVTVTCPVPTVNISADPESVQVGELSTLTWSSTYADAATIDQGIGDVSTSGSTTVSPTETTTYTITATGPGGTATASVAITVTNPIPVVEITADPPTIVKGESATLTWTSISSQSASIDNGIGTVPLSGSFTVSPTYTTTYTITVSGPLGVANAQATVMVTTEIEPQPEGSFGEQYEDLIPPDSSVESYDARRFSVITGSVTDQGGAPIADVAVTILHHPDYGTAFTDGEGRYSIPAEGGGVLIVVCEKEGLIAAHRKVYIPWNDTAIAETMVMIPQDTKATTVTFDDDPNTVVTHQSTEVTDEWGTRSCTTVFTGDNKAYLVDEEGNTLQALTTITTRATEFTTPESMPAKLPPNSAYTYCVELQVDGAERVRFENPVVTWVDNFLGFEVGMAVPVGTYDRDRGVWVPENNGVVVKLLDTDNDTIVDALDATGDDLPDDLNDNGSYTDEVQGLSDAQVYQPEATFWRFEATHFTPWDCNWPYGPPSDAIGPNADGEVEADQQKCEEDDCQRQSSSFIEERSRIFHEDIPIPGTDFILHYASNRVEGFKHVISVPASGDTVPASLKRIIVKVEVAGRTLEQILNPLPNQKAEFIWDGLDNLGRQVIIPTTEHVSIGFVYDVVYLSPGSFAQAFAQAGTDVTGVMARQEVTSWRRSNITIYPAKNKGGDTIAGGWTLSAHHSFSPMAPYTLHKGDGTIITNKPLIIDAFAGVDSLGQGGYSGEDGPATEVQLLGPHKLGIDAAGNLYIADWNYYGENRIRKVDANGIITTVAGNGTAGFSGDGGPATEAQLDRPGGVAVDAVGNIYITDSINQRIRKVNTNGIITTVAGNGIAGYSGDGGIATEAQLCHPQDVAVDAQGNIYIADAVNNCIRKVDANGIITTVAGNGTRGYSGDGGPATKAMLAGAYGVDVDIQGNIYIVDIGNYRIRKVDTNGIITTVAGSSRGYGGDGGPATQAKLDNPQDVAVDVVGNIYIVDQFNSRIRKVNTSGIIMTVAGGGGTSYNHGNGRLATNVYLANPWGVEVDVQGNFYISLVSIYGFCVKKVGPPAAFAGYMAAGDIPFADDNGLGYIMANSGRHKQTIDLDSGKVMYEFGYDEYKNLISITDRFENQTTITRDGSGVPRSITSPDGITTYLTVDGDNHLTAITYSDGSTYSFDYTPDGLMAAKIEPEGNRFEHIFDPNGRITDATDEEGGHWQFSRQTYANGDILTEVLSAEGDKTSYLDHTYSTGAYTSTITGTTGAQIQYARSDDGLSVNKSLPCGMELAFKYDVDPVYKYQVVTGMWEDTPAGLDRVTLRDKTYQDTNADEVPDLITEQVTVNDKATALVTDTLASTRTLTSPVGRTVTTLYDPDTLLTNTLSIPGLFDTGYGYDTKGRLTSITTNTRETSFAYNSQGFLESITDPEDHTTSYAYDEVGRMTGIFRPDGSSIGFDYDDNGNMTVLTTPTTIDHGFSYNRVNLNDTYQTPISGTYSYVYDSDRRLTQINFPSGLQINNIYSNDRRTQTQTPEGNIDFTYYCTNIVESATKGSETITYGYDGQLVTSETLSGTLNQTLSYIYNNDFKFTSFTYAGGTTNFTYDNDGFLTGASPFSITRNADNGLPEAVTGGSLSLTRAFNGYGEVELQDYTVNSSSLTSWSLARDDAGRITQKQETVDGVTSMYEYTYDPMGRLLTVTKDGGLIEEYEYGPNGARISEVNILRGITTPKSYAYSDEDHLLQAGTTTYQYDADGFLVTKTEGTDVTQYSYSSRGELLQVILPNGKTIDYLYDPRGRRIAKVVDSVITEKYLWQGFTRLLAVYDGNNNLLMRFEYADGRMPVAMTSSGNTYYLTYDQVGSLRIVSDAAGNVVKRVDYDSFGNILSDSNPGLAVPFGFAGGLHDRDTGLVRFGFRDYDPDIGRWTAKDPIGFLGGDTDLYGYCVNNPINFIDSSGTGELVDMIVVTIANILEALGKNVGTVGGGLIDAAKAGGVGLKIFEILASKDFKTYTDEATLGMHHYEKFQDIDWNKYGDTFEEAWRELMKDAMDGELDGQFEGEWIGKFGPCN